MPTGECKTPGGKLVSATLDVVAHRLAAVRVHGDFFVHPEPRAAEVLAAISTELTSAPADLDVPALAARVRAAIPFGVELLGTSPEAIAVAVRRAVTGDADVHDTPALDRIGAFNADEIDRLTASWKQLPWRLIPEVPLSPAMNVALDEVLADAVSRSREPEASSPPARGYAAPPPSASGGGTPPPSSSAAANPSRTKWIRPLQPKWVSPSCGG